MHVMDGSEGCLLLRAGRGKNDLSVKIAATAKPAKNAEARRSVIHAQH